MVVLSATCFHHPHRVSRFAGPVSRPDRLLISCLESARHRAEQQPTRTSPDQLGGRRDDACVVQFTPGVRKSPDDHDDGNIELVEKTVGNRQHAGVPGAGGWRNEGSADHIDPKRGGGPSWWGPKLVWAGCAVREAGRCGSKPRRWEWSGTS